MTSTSWHNKTVQLSHVHCNDRCLRLCINQNFVLLFHASTLRVIQIHACDGSNFSLVQPGPWDWRMCTLTKRFSLFQSRPLPWSWCFVCRTVSLCVFGKFLDWKLDWTHLRIPVNRSCECFMNLQIFERDDEPSSLPMLCWSLRRSTQDARRQNRLRLWAFWGSR